MNHPALCRRCKTELNPTFFGVNREDVTPDSIFYCWTCGPILEAEDRLKRPEAYSPIQPPEEK